MTAVQGMGARCALACACVCVVLLGIGSAGAHGSGSDKVGSSPSSRNSGAQRPEAAALEITPEALQAIVADDEPYLLIDAESGGSQAPPPLVRIVYYTHTPSFRAAQALALRNRNATVGTGQVSQRLTGTPAEWKRLGLPFDVDPLPALPLRIKPRTLSEAINDEVGLQILDVRPPASGDAADELRSPFPEARRLMPHEIATELPKLSKLRWIVLVDDGQRAADPLADYIFKQGYPLVAILDGGYAAWTSATDR